MSPKPTRPAGAPRAGRQPSDDGESLLLLALRVAEDPYFVSSALTRHRQAAGTTPAQQAAALGLEVSQLAALALCRYPRPGPDRAADVQQIAAYAGLRPEVLDGILGPESGQPQQAGACTHGFDRRQGGLGPGRAAAGRLRGRRRVGVDRGRAGRNRHVAAPAPAVRGERGWGVTTDPNASGTPRPGGRDRKRRDPKERFTMVSAVGVTLDGLPVAEWLALHGGGADRSQRADADAGGADEPFIVTEDRPPSP